MALCVMTPGTMRMPPWSAHNWDSHATVSHHIFVLHIISHSAHAKGV